MAKPRCWGLARECHVKGCRTTRPLCRYRRKSSVCYCDAYHYPHRDGSGRCGDAEAMDRFVNGPIPAHELVSGLNKPRVGSVQKTEGKSNARVHRDVLAR